MLSEIVPILDGPQYNSGRWRAPDVERPQDLERVLVVLVDRCFLWDRHEELQAHSKRHGSLAKIVPKKSCEVPLFAILEQLRDHHEQLQVHRRNPN